MNEIQSLAYTKRRISSSCERHIIPLIRSCALGTAENVAFKVASVLARRGLRDHADGEEDVFATAAPFLRRRAGEMVPSDVAAVAVAYRRVAVADYALLEALVDRFLCVAPGADDEALATGRSLAVSIARLDLGLWLDRAAWYA